MSYHKEDQEYIEVLVSTEKPLANDFIPPNLVIIDEQIRDSIKR